MKVTKLEKLAKGDASTAASEPVELGSTDGQKQTCHHSVGESNLREKKLCAHG